MCLLHVILTCLDGKEYLGLVSSYLRIFVCSSSCALWCRRCSLHGWGADVENIAISEVKRNMVSASGSFPWGGQCRHWNTMSSGFLRHPFLEQSFQHKLEGIILESSSRHSILYSSHQCRFNSRGARWDVWTAAHDPVTPPLPSASRPWKKSSTSTSRGLCLPVAASKQYCT